MTETDNDAPLAALALLEGKQLQSVSFRISPSFHEKPGSSASLGAMPSGRFDRDATKHRNIALRSGTDSVRLYFAANAVRRQLHVLAHNLGNFVRALATPKVAEP